MPKAKEYIRLTHNFVRSVTTEGRYGDGRGGLGLSLLVKRTASRPVVQDLVAAHTGQGQIGDDRTGFVPIRQPRHGQGQGPRQRETGRERRGHPEAATHSSNCG